MKISITIEADSVDEAKKACGQLMINEHVYTLAPAETPAAPKEEKPAAKTTKKAAAEPVAPPVTPPVVTVPTGDPLSSTPAPASDPLSSIPATPATSDPLAATAPATSSDPLNGTAASTHTQSASVTLATIREKIGTLTDKKQKVKDLVATYKKADGTPCEKPSDLQEKDYQDVLNDLDYV